ncbi:MAG: asparagine synthetase B, partial [Taibaiella sp.]|nr:asparagine synthetase B [Taibaiella sp.]
MCGIAGGIWCNDTSYHQVNMDAALASLRRRGPDGFGRISHRHKDKILELGHTRLAIIDRSEGGRQPMDSADGSVSIIFNGEI